MTENEQKQQFSIAYVHAVAARAGCACQATLVDNDSVDVRLSAVGLLGSSAMLHSPLVEAQLKATAQDVLRDDYLAFPLPVKNYEDLRKASCVPRLLVVLVVPVELDRWLEQTEEQMLVRHCAYWMSLDGLPAVSNQHTVTVRLPRSQQLTPTALRGFLERVSRREPL